MKQLPKLLIAFSLIFTFFIGIQDLGISSQSLQMDNNVVHAVGSSSQSVFDGNDINADAEDTEGANDLINKLHSAANVFAAFVLAISIIMIIVGGLRYILSNGNTQTAEQAKMIIIYSGIGIVIALSAFALGRLFASFGF